MIALLVLVLIFLMLRYTRFGRSLYAVGGNATSAAMMGLNVKSIKMRVHVLCSVLTSIGGICYCLNTMAGSVSQATGLEMDAISSAVIGGTLLTGGVGNVFGTFFGVLINGTISSIVKTNGKLASSWPNILTAILLFVFIVNCAVGTECLLSIILDWVIKRYRPIDIKCGVKGTMGIIQIEIPYGSACAGTSIPVVTRLIEKRVKTGQRIVCLELDVRKLDKHHQDVPGAVSQVLEN